MTEKVKNTLYKASMFLSVSLLIISLTALIINWVFPREKKYDTATEYMKELHVKYQGVKSDLVDATQNYIDSIAPNSNLRALILVEKCEEYKIPITFVLAQGELESKFGTTGLAYRTNSIWNVGAYDNYDIKDIKIKYENPNDSVEPYLSLLNSNYLNGKTIEDLFDSFTDINGNRYATDKYYESKLKTIHNYILTNHDIDSLQARLNYYKIRL